MRPQGKTLVVGNSPCAHAAAQNLLNGGADVILATSETACDFQVAGAGIRGGNHASAEVLTAARIVSCNGAPGDYRVAMDKGGNRIERTVSGVIVAQADRRQSRAAQYGLVDCSRAMDLSVLRRALDGGADASRLEDVGRVVFLNGLGHESHPLIAAEVMAAAMRLRTDAGVKTYVLTGNLKVAADGLEALYRKSREAGVVYAKFSDALPDILTSDDGSVQITFADEVSGRTFRLTPDLVVVDETVVPSADAAVLAHVFGLHTDAVGFLQADNVHRFTVLTNRRRIVAVGSARGVLSAADQLKDAAAGALALDSAAENDPSVFDDRALIDKGACVRCLTCIRVCPYGAVSLDTRPRVEPGACQRCGICAAECPCHAIVLPAMTPADISRQLTGLDTLGDPKTMIVAFCCSRSAARAAEMYACFNAGSFPGLKVVEVPCAGSVSYDYLFAAFQNGADGVLVLSCHGDNCHSEQGNGFARNRVERFQMICDQIGLDRQRVGIHTLASNMGTEFGQVLQRFVQTVSAMGNTRLSS